MSKRYRLNTNLDLPWGYYLKGTEGVYSNGIYEFPSSNGGKMLVCGEGIIDSVDTIEPIPDTPAPEQTTDNLLLKEIVRTTKNIFNTITEIKNKKKAIREEQTTKEGFVWTDELVKDACEYVGLRVNTKSDFREQMKYLIEDFKLNKEHGKK